MICHPADSAGVDVNRGLAIHENVILDEIIPAAADERRLARAVENVTDDGYSACRIVQIHGHGTVKARTFDVVEIIMAYNCSSRRPVAAHIKSPDVAGLEAHVMYFVKLDRVVVSAELDCIVGTVVNHIVRDLIADTVYGDGGPIGSVNAPEVMYMIIRRAMSCGR